MYGLVNKAVHGLVLAEKGEAAWDEVLERSGAPSLFLSMESYPDAVTYDIVGAAAGVLGVAPEALLRKLGRFWVVYMAREGYGGMFEMWGADLRTFLANLDMMHARVKSSMPELRPPMFTATEQPDGRIRLIYDTHREGLAPMVIGLLEGLSERFGTPLSIEHVVARADAGHDEFLVTIGDA